MKKDIRTQSKFLSLILRHEPWKIGLTLQEGGWVSVRELLTALAKYGKPLLLEELEDIVENNDKKRFIIKDGMIRANQGHSVEVDLQLQEKEPPKTLYHGTSYKVIKEILREGLKKMDRHDVHLSLDIVTAEKVGSRKGKYVILEVNSEQMSKDGYKLI